MDGAILAAYTAYVANSEALSSAVAQQRAARGADLEALNAARLAYLKRVEEAVAALKEQGLQGTAKVGVWGAVCAAVGGCSRHSRTPCHHPSIPMTDQCLQHTHSPTHPLQAAADTLLAKVEEARALPHAVLGEVTEAWGRFIHLPAVERLLAASRGQVEAALVKYVAAHDALVVSTGVLGCWRCGGWAAGARWRSS